MATPERKRVFILGAGFSRPVGMPLSTELSDRLLKSERMQRLDDFPARADDLIQRLNRLDGLPTGHSAGINIEQFFEFAKFDRELWLMRYPATPHRYE